MHKSALFLDRDGVINVDRGYIHRPDQFEFVPGIFELARFWTNELRRLIVVISNQSGIGRGYFDETAYEDLTRWMCDRFESEHIAIARVYHCPYHPCAVTRRRFPVGANPTRRTLQPEATGAAMEVTKWLKPSDSVSRNTVTARVCRPQRE